LITSIIFSKDRALQLDLTLKTIKQNFTLCDSVVVIYKTSEQQHQESYENLKTEHPNVSFYEQSHSLFVDILAVISGATSDYVCFFTDDNIVYNKIDIDKNQLNTLFNLVDPSGEPVGCASLSLRLGLNTSKRDMGDGLVNDAIPKLFSLPPFFVWGFTGVPPGGYWSYPLSVDGHIFKRETMLEFCTELEVLNRHYAYTGLPREKWCWKQTPNEFEAKLQRFYFCLPNLMGAMETSCVVNSPNNRVQNQMPNKFGEYFSYTATELNGHYKSGKRLNVDKINFSDIVCPHQEIDILEGLE
jgi:hypothetical protein